MLLARPGAAQPAAGAERWKPVDFTLDVELRAGHESNPFHVQRGQVRGFDTQAAPYERFHRMHGPADAQARLTLDVGWRWKHVSKRAIEVDLRTRGLAWRDSAIARATELGLEATFDLTRADSVALGFGLVPWHFRRNYSAEAFPGIFVYLPADVRDTSTRLEWRRDWPRRWTSKAAISRGRRGYSVPFEGRDERIDAWSAAVRRKLGQRVAVEVGLDRARARTGTSLDAGVPKDRSHADSTWALGIDVNLKHQWSASASVSRRVRDYLTDEVVDASRYGRIDRRWTTGVEVEKGLGKRWRVGVDLTHVRNDTGRTSPGGDDEELDWGDTIAGVAIGLRT
jgi:hypothetical protein